MIKLLIEIILLLSCVLLSQSIYNIFVSVKNGTDDNNCGESISSSCKSIKAALSQATNGSNIFIYPGIYNGYNNSNLCFPSCAQNITITGVGFWIINYKISINYECN